MHEILDEFEIKLSEETDKLISCQQSKNLNSCLKCDSLIGCEIRGKYVKAVYDSMSKGAAGDFEF